MVHCYMTGDLYNIQLNFHETLVGPTYSYVGPGTIRFSGDHFEHDVGNTLEGVVRMPQVRLPIEYQTAWDNHVGGPRVIEPPGRIHHR